MFQFRDLFQWDRFITPNIIKTFSIADSPYFSRYERFAIPIRLRLADVDGEPMIVAEYARDGVWSSAGIIRLVVRDGRIAEIGDYHHCPWVLGAADSVRIS